MIKNSHRRRVTGSEPKSGLRGLFANRAKRGVLLSVALAINALIVLLNVFDVFDRAPAVALVAVSAIEILFVLPVLIAVLILNLRDNRARRRGGP